MKKYILFLLVLSAYDNSSAQNTIDRTKAPNGGPVPLFSFQSPYIYKMPTGMTVLMVVDHKLPKVSANLNIDIGDILEGEKAGTIQIMGEMLREGIKSMTKSKYDKAIDELGADLNITYSGGSVVSLSRYFKTALKLMALPIEECVFSDESFKKIKSRVITDLRSSENDINYVASRVTNALAYGKNTAGGEYVTEETINNISLTDIKNCYTKYMTPARAYLTIVGDIDSNQAKVLVANVFGNWRGRELLLSNFNKMHNPATTEIDLVNMPGKSQAAITIVNLIDLKPNDPDYFPAMLANQILGNGFESRLNINLREKHAFTYGAYSSIDAARFQRIFQASATVRNDKVDSAIKEMLFEINRLRNEPVPTPELNDAKSQYIGLFALSLENPLHTSSFAENILINELPVGYYKTYLQKINAVTADDLIRVANRFMNFSNTRIVVVGDIPEVISGIRKLGYPIRLYDTYANATVSKYDSIK